MFGSSQLQNQAVWSLANIAAGNSNQTRALVDEGAVPLLIDLLDSPSEDVVEHAIWSLGNISGDGPELRDLVIEHGIIKPLLKFVNRNVKVCI